jgi:hypothetical protein
MDESGMTVVPNKAPKVTTTVVKGSVRKVVSAEGGQIVTVICAVSASGTYVPSAIIFPRKRAKNELLRSTRVDIDVFDSRYINSDLFMIWIQHFKKHVDGK